MEGDRRSSGPAASLLALAWMATNAAPAAWIWLQFSLWRPGLVPTPVPVPAWLPDMLAWAAPGLLVASGVAMLRTPTVPLAVRTRWHTRYLLVLGCTCVLYAGVAWMGVRRMIDGHADPIEEAVRWLAVRLFATTAALLLAAWLARRAASRHAGTLTTAANVALAAFLPAGTMTWFFWDHVVRPSEEGDPSA